MFIIKTKHDDDETSDLLGPAGIAISIATFLPSPALRPGEERGIALIGLRDLLSFATRDGPTQRPQSRYEMGPGRSST